MDSQFKEEFEIEKPEVRKRQRRKKRPCKPVFKKYDQNQIMLIPQNLDEMIPSNHVVRVVNKTIDRLNIEKLINTYKGGGNSAYNPIMLIKVLVYAYMMKIYSCRNIAKALREDINFMWLSGQNKPDFRTINLFRSGRLKRVIEEVFSSMIIFLSEGKYIKLERYFVDGTNIAADANKNSYVWSKNTKRYKQSVKEKVKELFKQIEKIQNKEDEQYGNHDLEEMGEESEITSDKIIKQIERLNKIIEEKTEPGKDKEQKKAVKQIKTKYLPKIIRYEEQEKKLNGRNSYSKTDEEATFLRMKNKELLPAYTVMIGTEGQYIINASIHQKASETDHFIDHMEKFRQAMGRYPLLVSSDSAYGSQENYNYLERAKIENYLKYNTFHYEQTTRYKQNKFHKDNFKYDEQKDEYECPGKKKLRYEKDVISETSKGYIQKAKQYKSESCEGCRLARYCKKGKGTRTIQVNKQLEYYRSQARKNLTSEKGIEIRKQRNVDVEPVFGDIKWNSGYRRFRLRGKEKVYTEICLLSIAHNCKKIALAIN